MHRRTLAFLPLLALGGASKQAWSRGQPAPWPRDVTEIRVAASDPGAAAMATSIAKHFQAWLGIRVVAVPLEGAAVAHALNAGHLEFALLDRPTLTLAASLMGRRLERLAGASDPVVVTRQSLAGSIHARLAFALAQAPHDIVNCYS